MEATLNRQNRGQSFDVLECYNLLKLLKKTGALSKEFTVKRKGCLGLLQRKVEMEMAKTTNTTDSSTGVVLEPSHRIHQMDNKCSDDVAAARLLTENDGMKTAAPGITSSLFWNKASHDSKLPLLRRMLGDLSGRKNTSNDSLLLKIKRELPNEFKNFSKITTHTFPDLFPIPLKDIKTHPLKFTSVNVRRHLMDFYDGRFSDKTFIFWMFGILTRHKSVYDTAAFFKRNTDARRKYEKMVNDPDLEDKLERAIENEDSRTAKKLNEKFSGLLRIVGGNTPWSSLERRATLGKLKALCGFFGLPSIFLTIAPCIADSEIAISLCNNIACNYRMKESTHEERSRWTAANPIASAKAFRLIIDTVVHTFIGIPTGNLRRSTFTDVGNCIGNNETLLAESFEKHLQSRRGVLGVSQAFFGIFEPQGRAALHMHALVWTLVNSGLIARCSKRQLELLCIAIDKVIATWINQKDVNDEEWEKDIPVLNKRCALRKVPRNMNLIKFGSFSKRIMYRVQYHGKCSFTCFKSKGFTDRCRLCKPTEEFPKTVFHILRENRAASGDILIPIRDTCIDPPPVIGNLSIPIPEERVFWLDHKRLNAVDGNMVDGNLSLSACLGWNTSVNFVAASGSAQSSIYYISRYMSKNPTQAKSILPLVYSAVSKRKLYPSKAEDSGSSQRNATYLTQIILNLLNGGDECADQMAASAVYNLSSSISSHNFVNLYAVDFINYVKSGGMSLQEDVNVLDAEDFDSEDDSTLNREEDSADIDSGYGQGARPTRERLSEDVGGGVRISIVRDIQDYLYRGKELLALCPYIYKSLIRRVSKKQMENRSKDSIHAGAQKSITFEFDSEHPLSHTHVQRLNIKPLIVKLVGRGMPKDPGPWSGPRTGKEFSKWYRKQRKLTDYIQSIFLPFDKSVTGMRSPEDIEVELRNLKKTYIGQHLLRTIHNVLTVPNVSNDWKKGIQLLRHSKSRKRSCFFQDHKMEEKPYDVREEEDVSEILCAAQLKRLLGEKSNTRMDCHLKDVKKQQRKLFGMMDSYTSKVERIPKTTLTISSSQKLLDDIKNNLKELEKKFSRRLKRSNSNLRKTFRVDEENFYKDFLSDQRVAGHFFLKKIRTLSDDDQLLMLLHGQPGSGKTFFVERVRDYTNLRMRITASSGIAGMSLGGTTLDWLMGFSRRSNSTVDLDTLRKRFGGVELLIIDEISMIGCRKLLKVDNVLKKVFNNTRPFGGLHVLLVGDFAQLPAVKQSTLIDTMVNSTKTHVDHSDLEIQVEALFGLFKKYELRGFRRSKDCKKLKKLLKKFRDYEKSEPTLSEDDLKQIGILNESVLRKDPEFCKATILVTTRRERDAINKTAGREWARQNGVPVYWWFQRSCSRMEDALEADHYAHSMSEFCSGIRAYYIPGAKCMLKSNPNPPAGYANGSQGRMLGVIHEDSKYVLPTGSPGQMIMIPPPMFVIMEVHHKGKDKKKSILPCKKVETTLEYYRDKKECIYRCWSNMVVLTFALTVHETQGQTLERIILLLGRLPGMNVGLITWSLLYVALSRTRKLSNIKFFPTGSIKYYHSMYFSHLLKRRMPENLKRWHRSYVNHNWDRNILRNEHLQKVKQVETRLKRLGEEKTKKLYWDELQSLVKKLGHKTTTKDNKTILFGKLKEHMVKQLIWKSSKDVKPVKRKKIRPRKRANQKMEAESSQECKSSSRRSKRLRRNRKSKEKILMPQPIHSKLSNVKGLDNLGQTCYFNCIVQCLFHCPLFRDAIENLPQSARNIPILRELQRLFIRMARPTSSKHLSPSRCFSAAMKIPECERAGMNKNRQEDARGFFFMLVEYLRLELKPLSDLFEGELRSTLSCRRCSHSSMKNEPFKFLALSLPVDNNEQDSYSIPRTHDIYDLIDGFTRPEFITGYNCTYCGIQDITEKKLDILRTPHILVLGLKRFKGLQKLNDFVKFPSELSLKNVSADNEQHQHYRITGVVLHTGPSIAAGHYISYVYSGGIWLETNDSSVREVQWETVKNLPVYLLFYLRI